MTKASIIIGIVVVSIIGYLWYSDVISFDTRKLPTSIDVPSNIKDLVKKIPKIDNLPLIKMPDQITGTFQKATNTFKPEFNTKKIEQLIFQYTNEERVNYSKKPLSYDDALAQIALDHSQDMSNRNYFEHVTPEGKDPKARADQHNYSCIQYYDTYYTDGIGENLALHWLFTSYMTEGVYTSYTWHSEESLAKEIVDGWMNSTGHRENILDPSFDRIGIGVVVNGTDAVYSTQNFC